jgi:hypothetical protein
MFHVKHQPLISPLLDDCALWLRPDYRELRALVVRTTGKLFHVKQKSCRSATLVWLSCPGYNEDCGP